ncbi:hypothetical protein B5X24_HaOG202646 [Helicoverpa armigera]|uniref:Cuticle protein n=1 Tax=Helicoverpa armigera TaxID=29058 RepID=A0A2W1C1P8_HELAM|nr:hypothetical protein B5X24_HaOG202646 [Helicoverpa armigera]
MKLIAPITAALIAAASAGQVFTGHSSEHYAQSAEQYQSGLEHQQLGLYSEAPAPQSYSGHEASYSSRPAGEKVAKILSYNAENNGHQYQYNYETDNGIKAEEAGQTSEHGTVSHGAYSYKGDDGQTYTVTYTADEHGFHPQGAHLPTPPPIPEEIQKSLEQNAKDEAAGVFDDGKYKEQSGHKSAEGYQQYDASYQSIGYQAPSSHSSGAELSYQIPSGHASGADLAYHAQLSQALSGHSGAQLSYQAPSSHASNAQLYQVQSAHSSNAQLAYHAPSGLGSSAQLSSHAPQGFSLGGFVPSGHSSNAQLSYNPHSGHAYSGQALGAELAYRGHH